MSYYSGNYNNETLTSANWNYSWTEFYMSGGNDYVAVPETGVGVSYFSGGSGNDYFFGNSGADRAGGDSGDDSLSGYAGSDILYGGTGRDTLWGGNGSDILSGDDGIDHLYGGADADTLYGGTGTDYFHITKGDSNSVGVQYDTIADWDVRYDYIDSSIAGTSSNYREVAVSGYFTMDSARYMVEHNSSLRSADHVFLYNAQQDIGYLVSDLDRNYSFETGVIIKGAGSASDLNWSDII